MNRPQPLFILTCMRSFSSLTCAMLGRHPRLYGLPEQNLFVARTVGAFVKASRALRPTSLSGLLRAVAELEFGGQTEEKVDRAIRWLEEREDWSSGRMHEYIMDQVAPRVCIDKSPSSAMTMKFLERLEQLFPEASILHLTRHPRTTCRSLYNLMMSSARDGGQRARKTDQEGLWLRLNANILEFSAGMPPAQYMHIRGEDLLARPEVYLPQIIEWLGFECRSEDLEAMLHPEHSTYAFVGPDNAPYGNDVNFLEHPHFVPREIPEAKLAGPLDWKMNGAKNGFSENTVRLARQLGYR